MIEPLRKIVVREFIYIELGRYFSGCITNWFLQVKPILPITRLEGNFLFSWTMNQEGMAQ